MVHSADPENARVILKMHDSEKAKMRGMRYGTSGGLVCYLAGKAELNGVVFDNVHAGGIIASPAVRKTWM